MDRKVEGKDVFNKKKTETSRKNKKENDIMEEMDNGRGASDREVEDCDIELRKDHKKMKRNKEEEKKKKGSDLDFNNGEEGVIDEKNHLGEENKKKKKRKLEHKKDGECEKDVESKDAKNWKKENKKELKKHGCCDDGYCNIIEGKDAQYKNSHVGGEKSVSNMGMSENEEPCSVAESGLTKEEKKRKRKKEKHNKYKDDMGPSLIEDQEVRKDNGTKGCKSTGKLESSYIQEGEERGSQKKKKKKKEVRMDKKDNGIRSLKSKAFDDDVFVEGKNSATNDQEKNKYKDHANVEACSKEIVPKNSISKRKTLMHNKEVAGNEDHLILSTKKKRHRKKDVLDVDTEKSDDKNKRKDMLVNDVAEKKVKKGGRRTKRRDEGDDHSWDSQTKKASKRVRFSGHVEVFPSPSAPDLGEEDQEKDLNQGKRFSREEDEKVKDAVSNYIKVHDLGEEGLNMVLHCKSHPEVKNCWKEIGAALPWRTRQSVYYRAHILYERAENRKWTPEECELVRRVHEKHGSNWKMVAEALGKHRFHVKDTWRRIKLPNLKKGRWAQEEYQSLFDLVNKDLRMRVFEEKKSKHGMLRDNICWGAISDELSTRSNANCCMKWYDQLTSPMVAEGRWADTDDYRLLNTLYNLDASCVEDVDWDNLLEHRSGDDCRKRWNQMTSHIGKHGCKPFIEQVEVLSQRYCPELLEVREAYDSKPRVP